jgi:hypothetical protein
MLRDLLQVLVAPMLPSHLLPVEVLYMVVWYRATAGSSTLDNLHFVQLHLLMCNINLLLHPAAAAAATHAPAAASDHTKRAAHAAQHAQPQQYPLAVGRELLTLTHLVHLTTSHLTLQTPAAAAAAAIYAQRASILER